MHVQGIQIKYRSVLQWIAKICVMLAVVVKRHALTRYVCGEGGGAVSQRCTLRNSCIRRYSSLMGQEHIPYLPLSNTFH